MNKKIKGERSVTIEYEQIKKIINDMSQSRLNSLNIEFSDGAKIILTKDSSVTSKMESSLIKKDNIEIVKEEMVEEAKNIIKSPMVGTFYLKPAPDKEDFVKVGDKVEKGQVLCIIEAMKLMNEIESEYDGEIVEICVNNEEMLKKAAVAGADIIISGAGLPKNLPELVEGYETKIAPIVSSVRAANLICKLWTNKYDYIPDMIVVEGPKAGGHLGFNIEELSNKEINVFDITSQVRNIIKQYEDKYNKHIPVISAGGIFDGKDIVKALKYGADGVQIATKFVVTKECDADIKFKEAYVRAKKEDIIIIKSPIGKPGRTIKNHFLENLKDYKLTKCFNCIKTCDRKTIPYCITQALINSVTGNIDNGLIFCGSNVDRIDKITDLKTVISELIKEANENYE